jgi:plasmid stabilization system protein ParE
MLEIVQRPSTRNDIKGIWRHIPKPPEDVHKECLVFSFRRHIIVYSKTDKLLIVQRVLHDRMDITRHNIQ